MAGSVVVPEYPLQGRATERISFPLRQVLLVLLVCAGYYLGALIGKSFRFPNSHLSLIWPPTAILLAALLLAPPRSWWVYLLAVSPVHILVQLQDAVPVWGILSQLVGNFGQALTAAIFVRYFANGAPRFDSLRDVIVFTVCAVTLAPLVISTLAAYLYVVSGWEESYWYVWRARVVSNALSTLTIVPPIVLGARGGIAKARSAPLHRYVESGLLAAGVGMAGLIAFGSEATVPALLYAPLPLLLWAAVRFGIGGLCLSLLVTAYLAFLSASSGQGLFATQSEAENVLSLQLFLITISLPLMFLAALVEERREKAKVLGGSEARFRTMADTATDAIITMDENSSVLFVNAAVEKTFGYIPAELIGQKITVLMPESLRQRHEEGMRRYLETGEKSFSWNSVSFPALHKSGREIIVDISFAESRIGDGRLFTGIMRDVTERKRAESRLHTQYAITRILSDSASIADAGPRLIQSICESLDWEFGELWRVDRETNLLTCDETWHLPSRDLAEFASASQRFTFPPGLGLPGRVWETRNPAWISDLAGDTNLPRIALAAKAGLRSGFGFPILLGNETLGVMLFFSREVREPDQNVLQMMAMIGSQIGQFTERKRAEKALQESEERLGRTEKFSLVMVTHTDLEGRWLKVPPTLCALLGYTEEELVGRRFHEVTHPDDIEADWGQCLRLIRGEIKSFDLEKRYIRKDGRIVWVDLNVSVVTDPKGTPVHFLTYIRDITQRKQAEEALKTAMEEVHRLKERLEADNVYLQRELSETHRYGEIMGESEAIRKVLRQLEQVAATDVTVLLLGETGTGKELVARAAHAKSARRDRPLVKVNCSALPSELIESELFGHEKGAFTGVTARQVGRFELADGATIFLDEIGELALKLQTKLLRVLQEGEFERLGSAKTIRVNVRVIAATNRDLAEAMRKGRFRPDLYYRLNVYPIRLPPLRERREDIGLLARAFLTEVSRRLGRTFEKIPEDVLEALRRYDWPGNVRELENVIERAALISTGRALQLPEAWGATSTLEESPLTPRVSEESKMVFSGEPQREVTLEQLERMHIVQVLEETGWRVEGPKGAAVILGLKPSTLRSRMQKLGIRRAVRSIKESYH